MRLRIRRYLLIGALLVMWLVTSACSCSGLLQEATRLGRERISPTATPTRDASLQEQMSTPRPTVTPSGKSISSFFPEGADQPFDIRVTEQELDEYLVGRTLEQEGVVIGDMAVTIEEKHISVTFRVAHERSGIRAGVKVRGVPRVEQGRAYVEIEDIVLDDSVSGFARIVARRLIKAAIEGYETEHGIPVPAPHLEFEEIELMPGAVRVAGRTR